MDVILEARGLVHAYDGGVEALSDLCLTVPRGQRLAILGPNGAGKTTLLMHLNGTLRPSAGQVLLDGQKVGYGRADLNRWRRRVGLVLQEPDDQLFAANVAEDVSFGPLNLGLPEAEAAQRVAEALESLRISHLADRPTHMLSFGQKKRVAIAGAVAMRPEVLLLDEPSAGLDAMGTAHLLAALDRLQAMGTTLVFTTHDVDLAWAWSDAVALFHQGRVIGQGTAEQILGDADTLAQVHLKPPFALALGLKARQMGWLDFDQDLPRSRADSLALLDRLGR
ncbi:energy-coupling factor ABC transporter ATP-binding protein [Magnetospirillum gryphiswaldense]|uniref:ABC transporter ATP-binding protein n=1 Tax=Magnetospirillum gryphiswaldense TaxID=55518 RepID=A4U1X4_9PROT|nr:ATP-binding cassette domain-containing protein [Magnetospirillum gryphiswaldense]AVM73054.1 Cobalt import ATP-binding protein CbiO [Magnetospirillum gryphiswaldense MSR-1]AVM76957.1 Cobalt import ATP-binding protein CbiO [Magnetospirillum gryphiswaldense]CAM76881.1 Cobalt transport protein ATP-binding subunit [Magnetospirillum gryphiswaldense MSR-1]